MVALILAVGAVIYFTVEKVRDHRQKKRESKDQTQALQHGIAEPVSIIDNKASRRSMELPPPYRKEALPPYRQGSVHQTP
ncbi:hypothetical protein PV05_04117 [Exophiala xenobiotica]|uniref:Uncharacterized protein n=1 Tax=Exophiala xenobiotica TaxID=348802 RepID=A0A0D2DBK6_9EURO|nr:uncharacterized protein PV05_04117 [Exophiala xenobiotica]KIW59682.1 hypothetical protein PV05_04117 [Exophiala xenobiotica]